MRRRRHHSLHRRRKKRVVVSAVVGIVLAIVCHFLPHNYQTVCRTVASICTGGIK